MCDARDLEWQWYIKIMKIQYLIYPFSLNLIKISVNFSLKIFQNFPTYKFTLKIDTKKYFSIQSNSETHAPKTTVVDTASIMAPAGQGCPRCGGAVFAAEMVLAKGSEWHKKCFKCKDCTRTLDSIIACDGPDKDVYCRSKIFILTIFFLMIF